MELDDLKNSWKQSTSNIKNSNTNIMELIQNKSYGPIASLKNRFRKQLVIIPIVLSILVINLSKHHNLFSDVLFWFYILFMMFVLFYFYFNYKMIRGMQNMDHPVKANLEKQIHILETGIKWRLIITRIMLVVFLVLLEILLFFNQEPSLVKWYAQPLYLRLLCYSAAVLLFFLFTKVVFKYKYSRHISYLKELVQQMQ